MANPTGAPDGSTRSGPTRSGPTLRVFTLNVGSLFEPDWDRRRHEIVAWLDRLDPDVVLLQEVQQSNTVENTAGWLADAASEEWHWAFGGDGFDPRLWSDPSMRFGSAVLSRWPIETSAYHRLGHAPNAELVVEAVPWELFHVQTAGLDLFSTHLAPAPSHGNHRCVQVVEIDRIIRSARGSADDVVPGRPRRGMPPILCGDFNAEPMSDEIRYLCGFTTLEDSTTSYQDAWSAAGDGGPGYTGDWRDNPYSAALNIQRKRIDYVFVGDPFLRVGGAGRVLHTEVTADRPLTGIVASDHRGLICDIVWPDRPEGN